MTVDRRGLVRVLEALSSHEAELRDLDAATGDGDLGITVRATCDASQTWLRELPAAASWSEILRGLGQLASSTNPSTFASLVSRGLVAAARCLDDTLDDGQSPTCADAALAFEAGVAMIRKRGGAEPGEKTFVDALVPAAEALKVHHGDPDVVTRMLDEAVAGTERSIAVRPRHGRAAWVGDRAEGLPDAGSVVVIRALEALEGSDIPPWAPPSR